MPIPSPYPFLAAYLDHAVCELRAAGPEIVAYVPNYDKCETRITLGTSSFVAADAVVRSMGLEPMWG